MKKLLITIGAMLVLLMFVAAGAIGSVVLHAQVIHLDRYVDYGSTEVRLWQNYALPQGQGARDMFVLGGDVRIDGTVDRDAKVVLGDVHLGKTAVIDGSLIVTAGDVWIEDGAVIRRDLAVIGGIVHAPAGYRPGGGHFFFGAQALGQTLRALAPWVTKGLLWGRVFVPSIPWLWLALGTMLIVTLAINLLLFEPVGKTAAVLAARPVSAFMAGLLMLVLVGPLSAVMAVSVIGIALIPFFLCAMLVAWIVGKVAVSRWIGDSMLPSEGGRGVATRSVLIGSALICFLYAIPVIGIVTWGMIGVFGLGSTTLAFFAALRRERPAKPPKVVVPPPVFVTPPPPSAPAFEPRASYVASDFAATDAADDDVMSDRAGDAAIDPPVPPPLPPPPAPSSTRAALHADLRGFPRAQFIDRLAAAALDIVLLGMLNGFFMYSVRDNMRIFLMLGYFVMFWAWKGTTLGGIICNLRVVRVDGAELRFSDALVRGLAGIFSVGTAFLGFLWILRDPERQAWHDRIAGTYVVRVPRDWPLP